jgi:hypothetical protein
MILIFSAKSNNFRGESIFSASFVIYISISMVEIMWVRVNYKVMFIMVDR